MEARAYEPAPDRGRDNRRTLQLFFCELIGSLTPASGGGLTAARRRQCLLPLPADRPGLTRGRRRRIGAGRNQAGPKTHGPLTWRFEEPGD